MWKDLSFKERAALINQWHKEHVIDYAKKKREYDEAHKFEDGGDTNPMNYEYRGTIYDDDLKAQGITHVAELPEITVTGRNPKNYRSAYAFNPDNVWQSISPNDAERVYNSADPNNNYNVVGALMNYYVLKNKDRKSIMQSGIGNAFRDTENANNYYNAAEAAFAKYLGLDDVAFQAKSGRKGDKISNYILPADYLPTKGSTYPEVYKLVYPEGFNELSTKEIPIPFLNDYIYAQMVERNNGKPVNVLAGSLKDAGVPLDTLRHFSNEEPIVMGTHPGNNVTGGDSYTVGFGLDPIGSYISYYDEYDLNAGPFNSHKTGDIGLPVSHPFSLYDRKYYSKEDSTRIMDAYHKYGEKAFDRKGKLRIE